MVPFTFSYYQRRKRGEWMISDISFLCPTEGDFSFSQMTLHCPPPNIKSVLFSPAGLPCPQNPRAVAELSWHTVAEMSFFNYVVLRGIYYLLLRC